jgi:NTE family protein
MSPISMPFAPTSPGKLRALALCATSYFTARSVSFFEADTTLSEWSRAQRHGERVPLSLDYLMASLSVPFLFPPTCLQGEFFGDGRCARPRPCRPPFTSVRIACWWSGCDPAAGRDSTLHRIRCVAISGQIFGYMLDTLFSDQISADLENLNRINRLASVAGAAPVRARSAR